MTDLLPTPWPDLDKAVALRPGELVILAGPVSSGTSMAALNIAIHAGFDLGHRTLLYSAEINHHQTMTRILAERLGIDSAKFHNRTLTDEELDRIKAYQPEIANTPVEIAEDAPISIPVIRNTLAARAEGVKPVRLVMVDGLELVRTAAGSSPNDWVGHGGQQARLLSELAREFGVTIVATSHLARRVSRVPTGADVSSGLMNVADTVLVLHSPADDEVVVSVEKNRRGAVGARVRLAWQPEFTRLRPYSQG